MAVPDREEFAALLAQARAGSKEALVAAVELALPYANLVSRHVVRRRTVIMTGSDARQVLYLSVLTHFDAFSGDAFEQFAGWLAHIVANQRIDAYRSECAQKRGGGRIRYLTARELVEHAITFGSDDPVVDEALGREQQERLDGAAESLPERDRAVVKLYFYERMSFKSIGHALHESADAVRMRCSRALKKMRRLLGAPDDANISPSPEPERSRWEAAWRD